MSQNVTSRRQQRRPASEANSEVDVAYEPKNVNFSSSSEYVEWDRGCYDRAKESSRQQAQPDKEKLKFAANFVSPDVSETRLYKSCQKRAAICVKKVITEQDAVDNYEMPENIAIRNFIGKIEPETFANSKATKMNRGKPKSPKSNDPPKAKNEGELHSSRKQAKPKEPTARDQSDSEASQATQTSSDESKTFSQIYSEIYEESRVRREKAEQIYKAYTTQKANQRDAFIRSKSGVRTARWVRNFGELYESESTTEASNESEKEAQHLQQAVEDNHLTEADYKYLIQEQLDVIDCYQQELRSGYEQLCAENANEMEEPLTDEHDEPVKSQSTHSAAEDINDIKSESHDEVQSEISEQNSEKPCSQSAQNSSKLIDNEVRKANVLQFEHCEIYVGSAKSLEKTSIEAIPTDRSVRSNQINSSLKKSEESLHLKKSSNNSKQIVSSTRSSLKHTSESDNSSERAAEHSSAGSIMCEQTKANSSSESLELKKEVVSQRSVFNGSSAQIEKCKDTISNFSEQHDASFGSIEERNSQRSTSQREVDPNKELTDNSIACEESDPQASSAQSESHRTHSSSSRMEEQSSQSFTNDENSKRRAQADDSLCKAMERSKSLRNRHMPYNAEQSETESSKSIELRKSRRTTYRLNKSEQAPNGQKTLHSPANSTCPTERSTKNMQTFPIATSSLVYAPDSADDYFVSSRNTSANSSLISSSLSQLSVAKKYQDRASSPIQIIYSDQSDCCEMEPQRTNRMENVEPNDDKVDVAKSCVTLPESAMKSELSKERSQTSIVSEEKGVQYPSDDELGESTKIKRAYDPDEALLKGPSDLKEDELLDINLSDDELQAQAKLQAAAWGDGKIECSSNNSSCHSLPTGNSRDSSSTTNSSAYSISSYVPSVRFYRRTQPEVDVDMNLLHDDKDSPPVTYRKHVARLAAHALRASTNYYQADVELSPQLEQNMAAQVEMLYNSETTFQTPQRLIKREELLQQFNQRLQRQLKLIAPNFQ